MRLDKEQLQTLSKWNHLEKFNKVHSSFTEHLYGITNISVVPNKIIKITYGGLGGKFTLTITEQSLTFDVTDGLSKIFQQL